jgi:N utilization substance protein A
MKARDFLNNIEKIAQEYEIQKEEVLEAFKKGLISGCTKNYQIKSCCVSFNKDYKEFFLYKQYLVIDENDNILKEKQNENVKNNLKKINYITLSKAREIQKNIKIGEILNILANPQDFNFYASKEFKNKFKEELIKQKRENTFNFFKKYEKKLISAKVVSLNNTFFTLELEKNINTILLKKETLLKDNFSINERIQVYVIEVQKGNKIPKILVSRIHENFVIEIFKELIPEIQDGIVQIMSIARKPSFKTKIGLFSKDEKVDAIGACIGKKGNRMKNILDILNGEKINLFLWSSNIKELITNALKPAQINKIISINEEKKNVLVLVEKEQASLAIGKLGINVELSSKVIGWNIKIEILKEKKH